MEIKQIKKFEKEKIKDLYDSVGWSVYTKDMEKLILALENSTYVFGAYSEDKLVGIIRGLTDKLTINYIQDIIVHPSLHGKGVGSELIQYVRNSYSVNAEVLMTDDEPGQLAYYKKNGFQNTRTFVKTPLNCFVKFKNHILE